MEILLIIGILVLVLIVFTGGGILGWLFKGIGAVFDLLLEGWRSCFSIIFWIIFFLFLLSLAS